MNVLLYFVELFSSAVEIYICWCIIENVLGKKYDNYKKQFAFKTLLTVVFVFAITLFNMHSIFSNISIVLSIFIITFLSMFITTKSFYERFITALTYIIFIGMLNMLNICVMGLLKSDINYIFKILNTENIARMFFLIFDRTMLVGFYLIARNRLKKIDIKNFSNKLFLITLLILFFLQNFLAIILIKNEMSSIKLGLALSWVVFIGILCLVIYQGYKIAKTVKEKEQTEYISLKTEEHLQELDKLFKENSKNFHDFKHHLSALLAIAQSKNYIEICEYIKNVTSSYEVENNIFTGNPVMDMMLNRATEKADKNDIKFTFSTDYNIKGTKILESDLCSLISNILENAVEACLQLKNKRFIDINIKTKNGMLIITARNSALSNPLKNDFKSSKIGNHGWGIKIIKRIVYKYSGYYITKFKNNEYYLEIILHI